MQVVAPRQSLSLEHGIALVGGFGAVMMAVVGTSLEWTIRQFELATQTLAAARDAAQATERSKSLFLATTSHEVRTPLNGILGSARLMLDTPLTSEQRALMEVMHSSGQHLLRIVDDILDLTKLEAGKLRIAAEPYSPGAVLEDVVALFQASASAKGLVLTADASPTGQLVGDASRLRQVLMNLVHNAIKFTPTGSVTVRMRLSPLGEERSSLRCEVDDSGPGLPDGAERDLWEPFNQAEGRGATQGGTGLGLTICRRLVDAQHGKIGAENRIPLGARFWFELVQDHAARALAPLQAPTRPIREGARVLVVDDNGVNRLIAAAYLKRAGVNTSQASDGVEALEELSRARYDLVLMDCQMPNLDGLEATRRLRAREGSGRRTTVVALTASAAAEDAEACLSAGMDDVLTKPLDEARLQEVLRTWIRDGP